MHTMSTQPKQQLHFQRSDVLHVLLLLLLTAVLLRDYFLSWPTPLIYSNSTLGTDLVRELLPLANYIKQTVQQSGVLPLWRPYLLSGAPLVGHPVAPINYPTYWLVLLLPIPLALNIHVLLHLAWGTLGMYAFLRRASRLSPSAAFAGALIFGQAPRLFAHLGGGHVPMITALSWLPWAWLGFHEFWRQRRLRWAFLLGVSLAAMAINDGKYLFICAYSLGFCTLWFLKQPRRASLIAAAKLWLIAILITTGLAAASIFPTLSLIPTSERSIITWTDDPAEGIPPAMLFGVLLPTTLKLPEWTFFLGSVAVACLGVGLLSGWQRRQLYWVLGGLLAMIFTAGPTTPIAGWTFRFLPGGSFFRGTERWWLITLFALAVLAADGFQRWLDRTAPIDNKLRLGLLILAAFYGVSIVLNFAFPALLPFNAFPTAIFALAALIVLLFPRWFKRKYAIPLLLALLWVDLSVANAQFIRPEPISTTYTTDSLMENAQLHLAQAPTTERVYAPYGYTDDAAMQNAGLYTADGYDSFGLRDYFAYLRIADQCDNHDFVAGAPPTRASAQAVLDCPSFVPRFDLLATLNIRFVFLRGEIVMPDHAPIASEGDKRLYELDAPLGRAFGIAHVKRVAADQCLDQLPTIDARTTALVESPLPAESFTAPRILKVQPDVNRETFEVQADTAGLLIRSEAWEPHWQVWIDDQPASLERVNCALQGVWLPAGEHRVKFEYVPTPFWIGVWVSLVTVVVLLGLLASRLRHR